MCVFKGTEYRQMFAYLKGRSTDMLCAYLKGRSINMCVFKGME